MLELLRTRTRLWAVAGLWTGLLLTAFDAYAAVVTYVPQFRVRNDFRLAYGAALNAWQHGYGHLYDLAGQKAAVAGAWWLAERKRPALAGLALSAVAIKPQLALLVPLCLLVAGHRRMFFAWLAASAVMAAVALVLLGGEGLQRYRDALSLAAQWEPTRRYAIAGPLGLGLQVYVVEAVVAAVAVVAAWRHRGGGAALPIAIGLVGSLLFTPYVGFQDFAMLVLAGWLIIRSGASAIQVALMVVGYALLELALVVLAVPILLAEGALLLSLAWPAAQTPGVDAKNPRVPALGGLERS